MIGSYELIATVIACAFLAGAVFALPSALATSLANYLQLPEDRSGALRSLLLVLVVPMMVVSGLLIDKWGMQPVLLIGSLLAALALVAVERGASPRSAVGALPLLAAAGAALTTGSLVAMPHTFFPGHAGRSVNLGSIAIVLGALVTPALVRVLATRLEPRKLLLLAALFCLVPAASVAFTSMTELEQPTTTANWTHWFTNYRLGLLALMALLVGPLEAALAGWVKRYVHEQGYLPGSTAALWTGFWVAFLSARLAMSFLLPTGGEAVMVIVLAIVAAVTFGNMLGDYAPGSSKVGLWVIGACCGPLVPTVQGLVLKMYPDCGSALGIVNAAGALGMLALVAWVERSTRAALRWSTLLALLLLAPALVLALTQ